MFFIHVEGIFGKTKYIKIRKEKGKGEGKMQKFIWFYVGVMIVLIVGNALQIGTRKERKILNWFQIIIYTGILIWYVTEVVKGVMSNYFFFTTSLLFLLSFSIELWQLIAKEKREFLDIVFFLISGIPIVLSIALLSGMFL